MIKMILASTVGGGIGLDNKLPFYCPEDLQYFKEQTEGSIVIMGRKTFDSLPFKNGLPNRKQYVITTKDLGYVLGEINLPSKPICRDKKVGYFINLDFMKSYLDRVKDKDSTVWIIGGKSVYEQLFHITEEIHHTTIKGDYECDTFIDTSMWEDDINWCLEEVKTLNEVAEVKIWRKC